MSTRSVRSRLLVASIATALFALGEPSFVAKSLRAQHAGAVEASQRYFERQVLDVIEPREAAFYAGLHAWEDWEAIRPREHAALWHDLGLDGLELGGPLETQVVGTEEFEDVVVEKLHFQSLAGLYVTGNLYLPKEREGKVPAILYVCGHGRVAKDGVSYGNKVHYQHHGIGFAKHGFACLVIDTIQLGEIAGLHHGTHNLALWDWIDRGYTPAGMEAWNSMRAIDLLVADERIDGERIGVTGRSGGGAYSWWTAALDERVKVAAPVAGITDLRNHVVDYCVAGHCDCMFLVNHRGIDYSRVAALVAPRPLLLVNTDRDPIFPLDGVIRTIEPVFDLYALSKKREEVGVAMGPGPHADTPDIQLPVLRWMLAHLRPDYEGEVDVDAFARKPFEPEQLKVFETIPDDEIVSTIHNVRLPAVDMPTKLTPEDWESRKEMFSAFLGSATQREDDDTPPLGEPKAIQKIGRTWNMFSAAGLEWEGASPELGWTAALVSPVDAEATGTIAVIESGMGPRGYSWHVQDGDGGDDEDESDSRKPPLPASWNLPASEKEFAEAHRDRAFVYFLPSGTGPTAPGGDDRYRTHWQRQFYLLGKTLPMLRADELREALGPLLKRAAGDDSQSETLPQIHAREDAVLPLLAWAVDDAAVESEIHLDLRDWSHHATTWIGIARVMDPRELILVAAETHDVRVIADDEDRRALETLANSIGRDRFRLTFESAKNDDAKANETNAAAGDGR